MRTMNPAVAMLAMVIAARAQSAPDTAPRPDSVLPYPTKSAGTAVLLSFLIPGGGQFYTANYWKVPLMAVAEAVPAALAVREHVLTGDALRRSDTTAFRLHSDRRNTWLFFTGAALAYSMTDAWVSARMYGFDRQLRIAIGPDRIGIAVAFDP